MIIAVLNAFFLVVFVLSAAVQFNDPDPVRWAAVYLSAAAMCVLQMLKLTPRWLPPTLLAIAVGWACLLVPSVAGQVSLADVFASISMKTRDVEEAREIGGLLLVASWAGVLAYRQRRIARQ